MQGNFILKRIDMFDQDKLIKYGISIKQAYILKALFVMMNNNINKYGHEIRKTLTVDNDVYYDFNQSDIFYALPLFYKSKSAFSRDLAPLISKGLIIKYPIETKFLIKLNIDRLL